MFGFLATELVREIGDDANVTVSLNGSGIAQADLTVRPGATQRTAKTLWTLAERFITEGQPRP